MNDPLIEQLLQALRCLPGVGARTAQRMAVHLLERDRTGGERLAAVLAQSMREIRRCIRCRNFTSNEQCAICESTKRSNRQLCIVEAPADVLAIEQATGFSGLYFVLLGRLSPLDGIGPEQLGLELLEQRLRDEPIEEVIVATNSTVEGPRTILPRWLKSMASGCRAWHRACRWAVSWNILMHRRWHMPLPPGKVLTIGVELYR